MVAGEKGIAPPPTLPIVMVALADSTSLNLLHSVRARIIPRDIIQPLKSLFVV